MRLSRIRLRTLMAAVALFGLATWGQELRQRSVVYRGRASWHAQEENRCERTFARIISCGTSMGTDLDGRDIRERLLVEWRARMDYHSRMIEKYEFASAHPWGFVAPDPPAPEAP
jgi:hypothetical protein